MGGGSGIIGQSQSDGRASTFSNGIPKIVNPCIVSAEILYVAEPSVCQPQLNKMLCAHAYAEIYMYLRKAIIHFDDRQEFLL